MLMITGARGWEHEKWLGTYYPNEIAEDWHLTFYAKDFQTTLAPLDFWTKCSLDEIKEFVSDVDKSYPIIFEQNEDETDSQAIELFNAITDLVPNWVVFRKDGWQFEDSNFHIRQAEITQNKNLEENSAVFNVYSDEHLRDNSIREIMLTIKKEFTQFSVVYLYFDGALATTDVINTAITLRKMLVLD